MKVDYSRLKRKNKNANWIGPISFNDGNTVKDITVEIEPGTCADIPEAAKEVLEFFFDNYPKYKKALAEPILEYYYECKYSWGPDDPDDPKFPEVKDAEELTKLYSLNYILIHDTEDSEKNTLGLVYDCTWNIGEGMGIKMVGFDVDNIGIQGSEY